MSSCTYLGTRFVYNCIERPGKLKHVNITIDETYKHSLTRAHCSPISLSLLLLRGFSPLALQHQHIDSHTFNVC